MSKTGTGNFFEDFRIGQEIRHATARTVTAGEAALYLAMTGSRFLQHCSAPFARSNGLPAAPFEDLLTFHLVFGRTVPDVSLNAVANLGYADGRFLDLVYPGDTLLARSEVIGLKETSSGQTGIVWVRSQGYKSDGTPVLDYVRWVMVRKRDPRSLAPEPVTPDLPSHVTPDRLVVPPGLRLRRIDPVETGSPYFFEDFVAGEKIDHVDGMGVMESENRLATRLYQNGARVHFNDHTEKQGRLGACIVYGGVVMSLARALSFNGLGNGLHLLAINGGSHVSPCRAGDTVYAWSEVLATAELAGRTDVGALRLRLVATKDCPCRDFPLRDEAGKYLPEILLDLDYWVLVPRRAVAV
jgi:2-methylfumaryl-CoA hydratase